MSASLVEKIANAVLYEGYLLYPYRSSAVKNRQRWNFGVVYPRPYSEMRKGIEPCEMETQCLAEGTAATRLAVKVRCLRLVDRVVGYLGEGAEPAFAPAASIEIDGVHYESWQEAAECEMVVPVADFGDLCAGMVRCGFDLPASRAVEEVRDSSQRLAGLIVRTQEPLQCRIEISLLAIQDDLFQIGVRIANDTPYVVREPARETVMAQSLLSAHTILHVENGEFVSLLEPPPQFEKAASACRNVGTWPVLAGEPGCRDTLLSSPIILYDYPQIAPESPGDLFDGAEIDEILSLRILTLTDEEKLAMRSSDERARRILERTEALPPEHFMKLHGVLRGVPPAEQERP